MAFLPLILQAFPLKLAERKSRFTKKILPNLAVNLLWIVAILATLSRTAIIGVLIVFALTQINRLRTHKKRAYGLAILALLGILGLSVLK